MSKAKIMTDTHTREHKRISKEIETGDWNTWGKNVDPLQELGQAEGLEDDDFGLDLNL